MSGSSIPPVVCMRTHILFTLFVFGANSGVQHILCCVFVLFVFVLCTLWCQCLWIVFVLCTIWCQCLWIVHWWLSFRCSPTFIQKSNSGYWFDTNQMYIIKNVTCSRHGKNSFLQWSIASIAELTLLFSFVFVIVYLKHTSKND